VLLTLPEIGVSEVFVPHELPSLATWNPVGAPTVTFVVRLDPVTVKVWADEGVLVVVVKLLSVLVLTERTGTGAVIAPLTASELLAVPLTWLMDAV
jgi:hypothetical protein